MMRLFELARLLNVPVANLLPLIPLYIRLIDQRDPIEESTLIPLAPAAIEWLRSSLAPLSMRPIITLPELAQLAAISEAEARELCLVYNIPIHVDPAFGELITITGLATFTRYLYGTSEMTRFDRGAFLSFFANGLELDEAHAGMKLPTKPLAYSKLIELEIRRIASLPEPDRSLRSTALVECYADARTVAECLGRYKARLKGEKWLESIADRHKRMEREFRERRKARARRLME